MDTDARNKIVRIRRLNNAATELMKGDDEAARQWLNTPLPTLGNEPPLAHSDSEYRTRLVENLIERIRHGVFS